MIEDNTLRETVARVTGRADPNAEAAAIAAHAKDPLKNPLPPASGDSSSTDAPEAGEAVGDRESERTAAEERSSASDPEQPRETTGTSAGAEVARLVAEASGLPADVADLLSGSVAQMREQAQRLARYRDERTASASGAESLTRRPTPALRPGTGEAPAIDPAEVARQAREG